MSKQFLTINEAALLLGVSIKTLRRWDEKGMLSAIRTVGNQRRYDLSEIEKLQGKKVKTVLRKKVAAANAHLSINDTALQLGISRKTLRRWEQKGIITARTTSANQKIFMVKDIEKLKDNTPEPLTVATESSVKPTLQAIRSRLAPQKPLNPEDYMKFGKFAQVPLRPALFMVSLLVSLVAFGSITGMAVLHTLHVPTKVLSLLQHKESEQEIKANSANQVLASATQKHDYAMRVSVPAEFLSTASVSGKLTAPNILYSVVAGSNITISGDAQNPTISANVDNLEAWGVIAGEGITINGATITNSDLGSSQKIFSNIKVGSDTITAGNNTDTVEFAAGTGITLTTDTGSKKITIAGTNAGSTGISGITIEEGDVAVANSATDIDFLGGDFDVGESPGGEANVQLASTLTSVTGVAGSFAVGSSLNVGTSVTVGTTLTVGTDTVDDITGAGLSVSASTLGVNLTTLGGAG